MTMKPISLEGLVEYRRAVTNQDIRQHHICICSYLHFLFFLTPFILAMLLSRTLLSIHAVKKNRERKKRSMCYFFPSLFVFIILVWLASQFHLFLQASYLWCTWHEEMSSLLIETYIFKSTDSISLFLPLHFLSGGSRDQTTRIDPYKSWNLLFQVLVLLE